jgi:hypothetical protein
VKWERDSARAELESLMRRQRGSGEVDEAVMEYSLDELRDFLEADFVDVPVDLEFKRNLRDTLWELVQTRNRTRRGGEQS